MGIFAFLTASRLKIELTRQRDDIARLHQWLDLETTQKLEAEKTAETQTKLKEDLDAQRQKIQQEAEQQVHDMEVRLSTLHQEIDGKQRQRSEATEQNARLAEQTAQLETRVKELSAALNQSEDRIGELENEKTVLQTDLDKIMGNLTRW
jgi:chromosome segregation ATPase